MQYDIKMTFQELVDSGLIDNVCNVLQASEDIKQEVYLVAFEKSIENGPDWLDSPWIGGYLYKVCRNMMYNPTSKWNQWGRYMADGEEVPDEIDPQWDHASAIDFKDLLEDVMEFVDRRPLGEPGWYARTVLWEYLESSTSWRDLADQIYQATRQRISHQSLANTKKRLIDELEQRWLPAKGWVRVDGWWVRKIPKK